MRYSFIVPIYNRPAGLSCLLQSFVVEAAGKPVDYELILVEDGSVQPATAVIKRFSKQLPLRYLPQPKNLGPAATRNTGSKHAQGEYLIFIDSDTALGSSYLDVLAQALDNTPGLSFAGGTEALPLDSSPWQQAVHYSMCAYLATGGIRGSHASLERFKPRSHNMVIRRECFVQVGGFNPSLYYGEDIDLALRMEQAGYAGRLLTELKVLHARKQQVRAFFWQVYHSGRARVQLGQLHPKSTRLVHVLPAVFLGGVLCAVVLAVGHVFWPIVGLGGYLFALCAEITYTSGRLRTGFLGVVAACVQLTGYGLGYCLAKLRLCLRLPVN